MESLAGVDRLMMNGVRATLVLAKGATLSEADAKDALAEHGLKFGSLERCEVDIPVAAYVAMTPKSL